MRILCFFQAFILQLNEKEVIFDLHHVIKRSPSTQSRELIKSHITLPRHYFDFLVRNDVLKVEGSVAFQPESTSPAVIGMNIKSLGTSVLFDMCFSPQTYKLWQNTDAIIEEILLPADIFEEYVYRLGALSRFRYLGKVDDPATATKLGENDLIEFKRDFLMSKNSMIKAIVAFANSNNGNLFLGIANDGEIVGVNDEVAQYGDPDKYMLAITQYIQAKTTPLMTPFPKISLKKVNDKYVAVLFIEACSDLICGLDKNGDKYVAIRTNNQSVMVKDPHQIGEIYVKRRLGSEISRRLGLL